MPHAPLFIFNLLKNYDREHFKVADDEDSFVLGKLVYALGVFAECCGMSFFERAVSAWPEWLAPPPFFHSGDRVAFDIWYTVFARLA